MLIPFLIGLAIALPLGLFALHMLERDRRAVDARDRAYLDQAWAEMETIKLRLRELRETAR